MIKDLEAIYTGDKEGDKPPPAATPPQKSLEEMAAYSDARPSGGMRSGTEHVDLPAYLPYMPEGVDTYRDKPIDFIRGERQGVGEQLAKRTLDIIPNVASGLLQFLGVAGSLATEGFGDNRDYNNWMVDASNRMKNFGGWGDIYRENDKTWAWSDPGWWIDNAGGLADSAIPFAIGGGALGGLLDAAATGIGDMARLGSMGERILRGAAQLGTSAYMSFAEGAQAGQQVYDSVYQKQMQNGLSEGLSWEEADRRARHLGSQSAASTVQLNTVLGTAFNLSSISPFFRKSEDVARETLMSAMKRKAGETFAEQAARVKTIMADEYASKLLSGHGWKKHLAEGVQEAAEEDMNQFTQKTGEEEGEAGRTHGFFDQFGQLEHWFNRAAGSDDLLASVLGFAGGLANTVAVAHVPVKWTSQYADGQRQATYKEDNAATGVKKGDLKFDSKGAPVYQKHFASTHNISKWGTLEAFKSAKDALAADIGAHQELKEDYLRALQKNDPVAADQAKQELFDPLVFNATRKGMTDMWVDHFQGVAELSPEEAAKQGYPADTYKDQALKAVSQLKEAQAEYNRLHDKYGLQYESNEGARQVLDSVFHRKIQLMQWDNIIADHEQKLATGRAEEIKQVKVLDPLNYDKDADERHRQWTVTDRVRKNLAKDITAMKAAAEALQKNPNDTAARKVINDAVRKYKANGVNDTDLPAAVRRVVDKIVAYRKQVDRRYEEAEQRLLTSSGWIQYQNEHPEADFGEWAASLTKGIELNHQNAFYEEQIEMAKAARTVAGQEYAELTQEKTLNRFIKKTAGWQQQLAKETEEREAQGLAEIQSMTRDKDALDRDQRVRLNEMADRYGKLRDSHNKEADDHQKEIDRLTAERTGVSKYKDFMRYNALSRQIREAERNRDASRAKARYYDGLNIQHAVPTATTTTPDPVAREAVAKAADAAMAETVPVSPAATVTMPSGIETEVVTMTGGTTLLDEDGDPVGSAGVVTSFNDEDDAATVMTGGTTATEAEILYSEMLSNLPEETRNVLAGLDVQLRAGGVRSLDLLKEQVAKGNLTQAEAGQVLQALFDILGPETTTTTTAQTTAARTGVNPNGNTWTEVVTHKDGTKMTRYKVIRPDGKVTQDGSFTGHSGRTMSWEDLLNNSEFVINQEDVDAVNEYGKPVVSVTIHELREGEHTAMTVSVIYNDGGGHNAIGLRFTRKGTGQQQPLTAQQQQAAGITHGLNQMAAGLAQGAEVNGQAKMQEYADRIIGGESRAKVLQGLPPSMVDGVDAIIRSRIDTLEAKFPGNQRVAQWNASIDSTAPEYQPEMREKYVRVLESMEKDRLSQPALGDLLTELTGIELSTPATPTIDPIVIDITDSTVTTLVDEAQMENNGWRHIGKKLADILTVANTTFEAVRDVPDPKRGGMRKEVDKDRINKEYNENLLRFDKLLPGTNLVFEVATDYEGDRKDHNSDATDEHGLPVIIGKERFSDYTGADGRITREGIANVPIRIRNKDTGEVVGWVKTNQFLNARLPNTVDHRNIQAVTEDEHGQPVDNLALQNERLAELREAIVQQYNGGNTVKIEGTTTDKGAGSVILNWEHNNVSTKLKPGYAISSKPDLSLLPDPTLRLAVVHNQPGSEAEVHWSKGVRFPHPLAHSVSHLPHGSVVVLLPGANGTWHASQLSGQKLVDESHKTAALAVAHVIELYLRNDGSDPKVKDEIERLKSETTFDISTAAGLRNFINQYFTYTKPFKDSETLASAKGRESFVFRINDPVGGNLKGDIAVGWANSGGPVTTAVLQDGQLHPKFVEALDKGFRQRPRAVVYSDRTKGLRGINEATGGVKFRDARFLPKEHAKGNPYPWQHKEHDDYNAYVKSFSRTVVYGRNQLSDGTYNYVANPAMPFSFVNPKDFPKLPDNNKTGEVPGLAALPTQSEADHGSVLGQYLDDEDWSREGSEDAPPAASAGLNERLLNFLGKLNVSVEFMRELKSSTGFDARSATDLLYKRVLIGDNYRDDGLLRESAYVAYSFLGKKNKIRTDLMRSVRNMDNFRQRYDEYKARNPKLSDYKIRELLTIDFLADAIKSNFEVPRDSYQHRQAEYWQIKGGSALEKRLKYYLGKFRQFFERLFSNGMSRQDINALFDDIAHDVIRNDFSKFGTTLSADQQLTNYERTIASDPQAKGIVDTFQSMGVILTGSLSLRRQGTLYRPAGEDLHDLDFSVPHELHGDFFQGLVENMISMSKGASDAGKGALMTSLLRNLSQHYTKHPLLSRIKEAYPSFKVTNAFLGDKDNNVTISGDIDGYVIDLFFVNNKDMLDTRQKQFQDWEPIFKAKLAMGRAKDMRDFAHYVPFDAAPQQAARQPGLRHFTFAPIRRGNLETSQQQRAKEAGAAPSIGTGGRDSRPVSLATLEQMHTFTPEAHRNGRTPLEIYHQLLNTGVTYMSEGYNPFQRCL